MRYDSDEVFFDGGLAVPVSRPDVALFAVVVSPLPELPVEDAQQRLPPFLQLPTGWGFTLLPEVHGLPVGARHGCDIVGPPSPPFDFEDSHPCIQESWQPCNCAKVLRGHDISVLDLEFVASFSVPDDVFAPAWLVAASPVAACVVFAEAHPAAPGESDAKCAVDECLEANRSAPRSHKLVLPDGVREGGELFQGEFPCGDDRLHVS